MTAMSTRLNRESPFLPQELCDMVLTHLQPSSAWSKARLVCRNQFVLQVLGPTMYLPNTSIYIRQAQSWVFYDPPASPFLMVEPLVGTNNSSCASIGLASPSRSRGSSVSAGGHTGTPFVYVPPPSPNSASRFRYPVMASFTPPWTLSESQHTDLLLKMEDEVQVMVWIENVSYKHVRFSSLTLSDRDPLTLTVNWKELFNATLSMPPHVRARLESSLSPSSIWTAHEEIGQPGSWWNVRSPPGSSPEHDPLNESDENLPQSSQESWKTCPECDDVLFVCN